jgi:hypothetical protein
VQCLPASHGVQPLTPSVEYWPFGQSPGLLVLSVHWKPTGHLIQAFRRPVEYSPSGHMTFRAGLVCVGHSIPAGHGVHAPALAAEKKALVACVHETAAEAPSGQAEPAGQFEQAIAPIAAKVPAGHLIGKELVFGHAYPDGHL